MTQYGRLSLKPHRQVFQLLKVYATKLAKLNSVVPRRIIYFSRMESLERGVLFSTIDL